MPVDTGSIVHKLDLENPTRQKTLKIKDVGGSPGPDQDISSAGEPCRLVLEIGNSKYVEIKGIIRPACIPSMHK